jgi:hypothetical protein
MNAAKTTAKIAYAGALRRSRVDPQTIASETAQNANWNRKNADDAPLNSVPLTVEPMLRKKPESPSSQPAPPNANAKPHAHHAIVAMEKLSRIFATPEPAFLPREKPISRNRNPACMKITRTAEMTIQVEFSSEVSVCMAS